MNAFQVSLGKGQFVLRNFSGEENVHATWTGTDLRFDPPRWRTMGAVEVTTVKLKGPVLILSCSRRVLIKDEADRIRLYANPAPLQIEVQLGGSDPVEVLPKMKEALFYRSIDDALAAIPKDRQLSIPARMVARRASRIDSSKPACDCAADDEEACSAEHRKIEGIVPPRALKMRAPEMPARVRNEGLDGTVEIGLKVDRTGRPQDVWVMRPLGMGLDEAAAKSVLAYEFRPAMCHDKPFTAYVEIGVGFQSR